MKKHIANLPASIHAKIKQQADAAGRPFQEMLYYYAIERFLFRLSRSAYCKCFILKGGLAFFGWGIPLRRPTRDIDFQAYVDYSPEGVIRVIEEICSTPVEADGMVYDASSIKAEKIMADAEYEGVRVHLQSYLGRAYVWLQIDISFANVITPKEIAIEYPALLQGERFELRGYNQETTIAEKFQAMVYLGAFNSRMKDFYDIYHLAKGCDFDGSILVRALLATFDHRTTEIPSGTPLALSDEFAVSYQDEWRAFLRVTEQQTDEISSFKAVVSFLRLFLLQPVHSAAKREDFRFCWKAGQGWIPA